MTDRNRLTVRAPGGQAAFTSAEMVRIGVARARGLAAGILGVHLAGRRGGHAPGAR